MRRVEDARKHAEAERHQQYAEAAAKAESIWNTATTANDDHPYLVRKGIKANGTRLHRGALVIPVRSGGDLHSLQFIVEDGSKRFLSGGRITGGNFSIGTIQGAVALCIAEGFATGATIHQATGYPVAVAFNAGNLEPVAKAIKADADGAGYSWATIRRAQKALEIEAAKEGGHFGTGKQQWVWRLPVKDAHYEHLQGEPLKMLNNAEDAQQKKVNSFSEIERLQGNSGFVEVEI